MKRLVLNGAIAALLLSTMPVAVQAQAPAKDAKTQTAPDVKAFDKQLSEAQAQMKRMQEQAKQAKRGLWSLDNPVPPWQWRKDKVSIHKQSGVQ